MSAPDADFEGLLDRALKADPRYTREAYLFVERGLRHYRETTVEPHLGHITGPQVCEGVRRLAIHEFGPMARTVLNAMGIHRGEDVGAIVYNMIAVGLMSKTEEDKQEDFAGCVTFDAAFEREASW